MSEPERLQEVGRPRCGPATRVALVLAASLITTLAQPFGPADAVPLTSGQLLVGQGTFNRTGVILQYSSSGARQGTLDTTISAPTGSSQETGMCLDALSGGNLYTTNFFASSMSKFDSLGGLASANVHTFGTATPNSCVFDAAGNLYVGLADAPGGVFGGGDLLKFGPTGALLATFDPATEIRGTDWIDLAADQRTLLYTSEGNSIRRFDVVNNVQLPDYCSPCGNGSGGEADTLRALRILPGGAGVLVADFGAGVVHRYVGDVVSGTGVHIQSYVGIDALDAFFPFAVNLDPDGSSFWTADEVTGQVFRFAINGTGTPSLVFCGNGSTQPDCTPDATTPAVWFGLGGLAIVGEPTAALSAGPPTQLPVGPAWALLLVVSGLAFARHRRTRPRVGSAPVAVTRDMS
jgi:hypothetical protein